jgi:hypothetical protein
MLLLAPLRLLRLLTIPSRVAAHLLLRPRFGSLKLAIVFLGLAAAIAFFARRKSSSPSA